MSTLAIPPKPDPWLIAADILDPPPNPYRDDPVLWAQEVLGDFVWSGQVRILTALRHHRRVAVHSAHDLGKSFISATAASWWIDAHPAGDAFLVSSAPTMRQVRNILWREIRRAHKRGGLRGRLNLSEWYLGDEIVGFGTSPADYDTDAFQGIHARYVLAILDEAGGVSQAIYNGADAITTNENSRILAVGNPDDPSSHFAKICKPGSGWHVIHLDGLESPNFTGEEVPERLRELLLSPTWVEEKKRDWGEDSPIYQAKVRGLFPELSDHTLISPAWIRAAQLRELPGIEAGRYGADVARMGADETVAYRNRGGQVRLAYSARKQDTMETAGAFGNLLAGHGGGVPMILDTIGIGAGVYDRMRELGHPVHTFDASGKPLMPEVPGRLRFHNRRAEAWWALREAFEAGEVDLPGDGEDDDLVAQLGSIRWWQDSRGRIHIESKDEMRKRGLPSPDRADAVMMSFVATDEWHLYQDAVEAGREQGPGSITGDLLTAAM